MLYNLIALLCGILFGCGLTISQLINANKIQNFLDIFGDWDPSLAFVMFSALLVTWIGYRLIKTIEHPALAPTFCLPEKKSIDAPLVLGAAIFGIGWGLAGYCPGPAFTALGVGIMEAVYVVLGMLLSVVCYYFVFNFRKK